MDIPTLCWVSTNGVTINHQRIFQSSDEAIFLKKGASGPDPTLCLLESVPVEYTP